MYSILVLMGALFLAAIACLARLTPVPCGFTRGGFVRVTWLVVGFVCLSFMAQSSEAAVRVKVRGVPRGANVQVNFGGGQRFARPQPVVGVPVFGVPGHAVGGFQVFGLGGCGCR